MVLKNLTVCEIVFLLCVVQKGSEQDQQKGSLAYWDGRIIFLRRFYIGKLQQTSRSWGKRSITWLVVPLLTNLMSIVATKLMFFLKAWELWSPRKARVCILRLVTFGWSTYVNVAVIQKSINLRRQKKGPALFWRYSWGAWKYRRGLANRCSGGCVCWQLIFCLINPVPEGNGRGGVF